ncbi:hypothetical protein ABIB25_001966 [Nakamurella sp. UYEF19]|uniref:hypothetical protein n=1 Tax=Nakamurella sp. UYEF19 TaxID=1756392 RepID=UPI0033962B3F
MTGPGGLDYGPPTPPRTPASVHLWLSLAMGGIVALALYVGRVPVLRDAAIGAVLAAAAFVLLRAMEVGQVEWPAPPSGYARRTAATQRWRLNGFDSMVDKTPGLSPHLRQRLQVLATAILTRRELVPGSSDAIALLGMRSHDILYPELLTASDRESGRVPADEFTYDELATMTDRLLELSAPTKGKR